MDKVPADVHFILHTHSSADDPKQHTCLFCCWLLLLLLQEERQAAAEALVTALVDSQAQHDASHRQKGAKPPGSLDQEGGNRQQRMEDCLSCCSPLMVRGGLNT